MDFRLLNGEAVISRIILKKDSATLIHPGRMVALSTGLAVEADENSTSIAFAEFGAAVGETEVLVCKEKELIYEGTGNTVPYAASDIGLVCDMAISGSTQLIDLGNSTTKVFQINVKDGSVIDGEVKPIQVFINKPLVTNE